jgi:thioredoxin-related protein
VYIKKLKLNIKINKTMKKLILLLFVSLSFTSFSQQVENDWTTDMNQAIEISQETGKPIMLFFTGSDWCGWCKKLVKEVYKTSEFNKWAKKNVVLVEVDFPRRTKLSEKVTKQNKELQQMFGVRGYPTVWFVTPEKGDNGQVNLQKIGSTGYVAGGPTKWIAAANIEISKKK